MPPETWTILKLLKWTTAYFKSHQIEQPRAASEILLAHALGMDRVDLYIQYDRPLEPQELEVFKGFIQRRLKREPVAYIVGEKGFWSLDLKVTPDVLIPRPETETLVEAALSIIPPEPLPRPFRVLDLGTGSGAVVIALAMERTGHRFYAVDHSEEALAVARHNAQRHGVEGDITFLQGNWFEALQEDRRSGFDLIVSNPPYVSSQDFETLSLEISQYEPPQALDGGPDGLDAIEGIIEQAPAHMTPGGWLLLEIGHDQAARIKGLMATSGAYEDFSVIKDCSGLDRVVRARGKGHEVL
ncbi:MAG: peptide chain release factor N(5)-glutamine methyltransferase [Thermodesulfobacteriota bacterium]|nr:peptide chain release factor N(5)-glutamine methyltransferase [Thermodesulfobacteriota bacterium]